MDLGKLVSPVSSAQTEETLSLSTSGGKHKLQSAANPIVTSEATLMWYSNEKSSMTLDFQLLKFAPNICLPRS